MIIGSSDLRKFLGYQCDHSLLQSSVLRATWKIDFVLIIVASFNDFEIVKSHTMIMFIFVKGKI